MSGYGNHGNQGGGYGQANPYAQQGSNPYGSQPAGGNPYAQQGGNPYAQQDSAPSGGYGGQQQYGQTGNGAAGGAYAGGNTMEMASMNGQTAQRDPNAILNECREIDRGVDAIERNLERIRFLQQRAIDDPDASQSTATNRELDSLSSETMSQYRTFGNRLKTIKGMKASGDPRNAPQVGRVDRKLKAAINEYQQNESEFRKKLGAQMERQYRIVRPDASEQEVREAVEDTSNNQVFSQALMQSNRRGQAQSALRAVQGRHEAIQKIERQMIELAQLFQDVDQAIVEQDAAFEQIDNQGEEVHTNVGKANVQIDGAIKHARAARRKKWICLGIVILIILIAVGVGVGVKCSNGGCGSSNNK